MNSQHIKDYCNGCGLCHAVLGTKLCASKKGFLHPDSISEKELAFMNKICMSSGSFWNEKGKNTLWGDCLVDPFYAYSNNGILRKKASSGGMVSEIVIHLIENKKVDAIIQTKVADNSQILTKTVVNSEIEEIIDCCGSRYTISSPLYDICNALEKGKKYAFIGKPCDVMSVRNWKRIDPVIDEQIPFLISFICAGMPSKPAGERLLSSLNTSEEECINLVYRGNGWPGATFSQSKNGTVEKMSYSDSWGKVLGRDVALACRFCYDGIGEAADISCGDGWYIKDNHPDFSEHDGRNVVFIRTLKGKELVDDMVKQGRITCLSTNNPYEELKTIQQYQYDRRTTMRERLLALKMCRRPTPLYSRKMLRSLGREASVKTRFRVFFGTLKRIHQNKI